MINITDAGDTYEISSDGPFALRLDKSLISKRAVSALYHCLTTVTEGKVGGWMQSRASAAPACFPNQVGRVGGIGDWFAHAFDGAVEGLHHIIDIPLVHTFLSSVPYVGTAVTAFEVGYGAYEAAKKALTTMPDAAHMAHALASGDINAHKAFSSLPASDPRRAKVIIAANLYSDVARLQAGIAAHASSRPSSPAR